MRKDETMRRRRILIPDIDMVKQKNLNQFEGLAERGYRFVVVTQDQLGYSSEVVARSRHADAIELHPIRSGLRRTATLLKVARLLLTRRIALAEVYPDSVLQFLLCCLIKLRGLPIVIVARGAEYPYVLGKMSGKRKWAFEATYRLADAVVYKELYLRDCKALLGGKPSYHVANSVPVPKETVVPRRDGCRFLFMNSIKDFRHPDMALEAFLALCDERRLSGASDIRLKIVGLLGEKASPVVREKEKRLHAMIEGRDVPVELLPWSDNPSGHLPEADVFLLPADVVYVNYTLLEAMALGIPALVQQTEGTELLLSHEQSGLAVEKEVGKWKTALERMIDDPDLRERLGRGARLHVQQHFSYEAYRRKYEAVYQEVLANGPAGAEGR